MLLIFVRMNASGCEYFVVLLLISRLRVHCIQAVQLPMVSSCFISVWCKLSNATASVMPLDTPLPPLAHI